MLPGAPVPRSLADLLAVFRPCFTAARLLPAHSALTIAVDDTLFKRSGKKVFGAAWHHDGAAKGPKPIGFGNCWIVAGIVVQLPFLSRPVSGLPKIMSTRLGRSGR